MQDESANGVDLEKTMMTPEKTVMQPAASGAATVMGTPVVCPVCSTENAPNEKYCGDCGFLLSSTPGEDVEGFSPSAQPRLVEPSSGKEHYLKQGQNKVGREAADVLIGDPTVSRSHAVITLEDGKCWLEDAGSTNGTFAGDKRLDPGEREEIVDGTELKFGSVRMTLSLPQAEVSEEEASEADEPVEEVSAEAEVEGAEAEISEEAQVEESAEDLEPEAEALENQEAEAAGWLISTTDPSIEYTLRRGLNTIGRRAENTIAFTGDPYVSGSHAEIEADETGFYLTDTGSTNGTMLNGVKLTAGVKQALNDGDVINIGQSSLRFESIQRADQ